MKNWITLEYCILFYCVWMVYDFGRCTLNTIDWWQEVIIEIDKPPQQLSLF